jgi:hypothetical protein
MKKIAIVAALAASVTAAAISFATTTEAAGRNGGCVTYYGCITPTGGSANSGGANSGGSGGGGSSNSGGTNSNSSTGA